MNKKTLIFVTVLLVLALGLFTLTGCTKEEEEVTQDNEPIANTETEETNTVKEETSDIDVESLSDEEKIEHFLFLELNKMGTTVIIATHSTNLIKQFNFPVLHLQNGYLTKE